MSPECLLFTTTFQFQSSREKGYNQYNLHQISNYLDIFDVFLTSLNGLSFPFTKKLFVIVFVYM